MISKMGMFSCSRIWMQLNRGKMSPSRKSRLFSFSVKQNYSGGLFREHWAKYNILLEKHPITTKVITAGGIAAFGDINCQLFIESDKPFSFKRLGIFTFLGGVLVAPVLHVWYDVLGKYIPGVANSAIAKRLVLDQFAFAPAFIPTFLSSVLVLEGNHEQISEKLHETWWPACKANWAVWIPVQIINFRFIPAHLQVLYVNMVGLFWNSYLSYISHIGHQEEQQAYLSEATVVAN